MDHTGVVDLRPRLLPDRGTRGSTVRAELVAPGLGPDADIGFLGYGISLVRRRVGASGSVELVLVVAPDAAIGWRGADIRSAEGSIRVTQLFEVLASGSDGRYGLRGIGAHLI